MTILGISRGHHDAAASLISEDGNILFAGHAERYTKIKNDSGLSRHLVSEALGYSNSRLTTIAYYETPWLKEMRRFYAGQKINWAELTAKGIVELDMSRHYAKTKKIESHRHHLSHAAAGFQTSPYEDATILVVDGIGEWDTISIWNGRYDDMGQVKYEKIWSERYPHSVGLLYSAFTKRIGLKPNEEEYITMGMAAFGKPDRFDRYIETEMLEKDDLFKLKLNAHIGILDNFIATGSKEDIAAGIQAVIEARLEKIVQFARRKGKSNNLVYAGGVALNCVANAKLAKYFESVWIMPNPGDAGASLGAAALSYGKKLTWKSPYLGHNIEGQYPVNKAVNELLANGIVGVANGRAEFGPRALGNRSLLADPRIPDIKDKVNAIKQREKFRPFAPVILKEHYKEYFNAPKYAVAPGKTVDVDLRYMQYVCAATPAAMEYPSILHIDNTARVQTVDKDCGSGIRDLLEVWYEKTGCPMLLNTSLNVRGQPLVNSASDAFLWSKFYDVPVMTRA